MWRDAEKLICSFNFHRHAAVHITTDTVDGEPWSHYLAFTNRLKRWQILFVSVPKELE